MSQSFGSIEDQEFLSSPYGSIQKVTAAEQPLFHPAIYWNCMSIPGASPSHKLCPKTGLYFLHNRNWDALAGSNVFFCLLPGLICIPDYPFGKQQAAFNFVSLLTKPEAVLVLMQVQDECNKAASMSLFNTSLAEHVSLEEFEGIQTQTFTEVRGAIGPLGSISQCCPWAWSCLSQVAT